MSGSRQTLPVPARAIPVPTSVSPEAQAILAMPPLMDAPTYPPLDNLDEWRSMIAEHDKTVGGFLSARVADAPVTTRELDLGGVRVYDITPLDMSERDDRVCLDIHGGAFIYGAGDACRAMGTETAVHVDRRVWAVDYRMPPDAPFPAALDDCLSAYRALLEHHRPESIVVGGASAGGNLAAAVILRARDEGLPLPAAAVLMTPAADLTESGDSFQTNLGLDPLIQASAMPAFLLYAAGHDLTDPYVSPLFADFTKGFPPSILTTGTRDMLLSDTVRLHRALRAAGVPAELHVTEAGGHGGFFGMAPEDDAITREIRRFVDARSPQGAHTSPPGT
jgi:epsilon-lactone hydrolase